MAPPPFRLLTCCPPTRAWCTPPPALTCPQAYAQGNIIDEQLLGAFEREISASWVAIDGAGRERWVSRLDDFTGQVGGWGGGGRGGRGRGVRHCGAEPEPAAMARWLALLAID